jgi:hypothetical protein
MWLNVDVRPNEMYTNHIDLSNELPSAPNKDHMQMFHPREVDVSTNHIGAHKPFGVSSSRVRVLDIEGFIVNALF